MVLTQYDDVRSNLIDMLEDLDERLKKITGDVRQSPARDFLERAEETDNDLEFNASGDATRDEIDKVKQAISRIDSGTYGICLVCGQPIKKERLQAMPYSFQCTHCARKSED
ncbi:TraR/DksA family transcriptional regulator [Methylomarinum vadi]|uniref:TraR/DksA family transcriptional regulator n=1 Tax=Methylomarinum vadi TaxID=438855 RepID=UPI002E0FDB36